MRKNIGGELVGNRTELQMERDARFKDIALSAIRNSGENWAIHSLSVLKRNSIARILYLADLYKKILNVPGSIIEFGVHWGATMSTLTNMRTLLEPLNTSRKIYGFDTFEGFSGVSKFDGVGTTDGDYKTMDSYLPVLDSILSYHESISPFPEVKKYQLIKGDVRKTLEPWMMDNPHEVIALAIFDMDIYEPTKYALEKIATRLVKGSYVVFDEFACKHFPGETMAVAEVLGLRNIKPVKHTFQNYVAIIEIE